MCQIVLVSREEGLFDEKILLTLLADQIVLSGTSKDDFSALSGLEETGLKFLFLCDRKKGIALGSYMENLFKLSAL